MNRLTTLLFSFALLLPAGPLSAQTPIPEDDPIGESLFAPELIMQHRRAIDLTDEQRDAISRLIQQLQGRVVSLQWQLLDEMQSLQEILEAPRVDLDRAMDQLNQTLDTEKEIKEAHLEMLIRIKNVLRPDQQERLTRLKEQGSGGDG